MKRILLLITGILLSCAAFSQVIYQIKADSVRIFSNCDTAELILENHTQTVNGFLYNKGRGRTEFRGLQLENLGDTALAIVGQDTVSFGCVVRSVQFTTGDPGFPAVGDSVYTNPLLIGKKIKVFREHLFQYTVGPDRISFDPLTGTITFFPPLKTGERIYIEAIGADITQPNPPDSQHISNFNFTNTAQGVAGWIDLAGSPHAEVITAIDPATGFGITSIDTSLWNPIYYSGNMSSYNGGVTNGTVEPAPVVETNWFNYNSAYGDVVNGVVQGDNVRVFGLDTSKYYTLKMGASRRSNDGPPYQYGEVEYRVNGTNPQQLTITDNATNEVIYYNVKASDTGVINLAARKITGNTCNFGVIGWLVVEEQDGIVNTSPVVNAGKDTTIVLPENSITLNGSAFDPGGVIATYHWSQVSGGGADILSPDTPTTRITGLSQGIYVFRLTATNGRGAAASDDVTVTVNQNDQPPAYFVTDSAKFNFTSSAQSIAGWTDVTGNPSAAVVTAAASNGWTVSSTDPSLWQPLSGFNSGSGLWGEWSNYNQVMPFKMPAPVIQSGWANDNRLFHGGYNLSLSGLDTAKYYRIEILGSRRDSSILPPGRSAYYVNGQNRILNCWSNVWNTVVFDTVKPDANGKISIGVFGVDSLTSSGNYGTGYINGMKIYALSSKQTDSTGVVTDVFQYQGDSIMLNNGSANVQALVYMPHNYDPSKKYPVLVALNGNESSGIHTGNQDVNVVRQYGLPMMLEAGKDVYGLTSGGDTMRWIVWAPLRESQFSIISADELDALWEDFKTKGYNIDTSGLYMAGHSTGAAAILNYMYAYPGKIRNAVLLDPSDRPSNAVLSAESGQLAQDSIYSWLIEGTASGFAAANRSMEDSMYKYAPGFEKVSEYFTSHTRFNAYYDPSFVDTAFNQGIYGFLANPAYKIGDVGRFNFSGSLYTDYAWVLMSGDPTGTVITGTDARSGITVSSVSIAKWTGGGTSFIYPVETDLYSFPGNVSKYLWFTNGMTYENNGNNLRISGLTPGALYKIYLYSGSGTFTDRNTRFVVNDNAAGAQTISGYNNAHNLAVFTATADGSGVINVSVGYDTTVAGTTQYGILNALLIRKIGN